MAEAALMPPDAAVAADTGIRDRIARLRLIRSANIGPVSYHQLLLRFGSAEAALNAIPDLATRGGGRAPRLASEGEIRREIAAVERLGAKYLFAGRGLYPPLLASIETAPPVLIVQGRIELLANPALAIVGARNASASACRYARGLAHEVGAAGVGIVSGLARGIDTAAHQGALGSAGGTVAVVAGGIDIFYPPENEALQRTIGEDGLVVAEQPPGCEPRARHFPYRNRIIAALAQATLVVEAAPRSGSLITARLAAEMGRDVLAVPGSPLDPRAQGCNQLIRDGATLIQTADDVMEAMRPVGQFVRAPIDRYVPAEDAGDADRRAILELLGPTPAPIDEIVRLSERPSAIVQTVLLELELAGRLERHAGGRVSLG